MSAVALDVRELRTYLSTRGSIVRAVDGVDLHVGSGETVGLVGESGCGKTMLGLSILRLLPEAGRTVSGRVLVGGHDVLAMGDDDLRRLRGRDLTMSFQDPSSALNPLMRVGSQVHEVMAAHDRYTAQEATNRVLELLEQVRLPESSQRAQDYPHQFSGGMRQRVMIAMGIANQPSVLIADEPTTALDVTTKAEVIGLLDRFRRELDLATLLITHDMGLIASLCSRVYVMYAGRIVEHGPVERIFAAPQHPYTWHLLSSVPRIDRPATNQLAGIDGAPPDLAALPDGCPFHPRCPFAESRCHHDLPPLEEVAAGQHASCWIGMDHVDPVDGHAADPALAVAQVPGHRAGVRRTPPDPGPGEPLLVVEELVKHYHGRAGNAGPTRAVDGVDLYIHQGETLGVIGESGCGKSTLARLIARLIPPTAGHVTFRGQELTAMRGRPLREMRREIQIIFQDPFAALDPHMTVGRSIGEPLDNYRIGHRTDRRRRVGELLDLVGLDAAMAPRYPHEFSGGQRQRIVIARALALEPSLLICDEPVSSLDVSIQAQVLNLFTQLQAQLGLAYLFIAHDLAVVRHLADRVAVMRLGRIVETAPTAELFHHPQHPYTRAMLDAITVPDPR